MIGDTLGSVGVIISSFCVYYFGWTLADAICSILISILIVAFVIPLIRETALILLQHTPSHKHYKLRDCLLKVASVKGVVASRGAHFWCQSEQELIGTLNVEVKEDTDEQHILQQISSFFKHKRVGVTSLTVQIEKEQFLSHTQQN